MKVNMDQVWKPNPSQRRNGGGGGGGGREGSGADVPHDELPVRRDKISRSKQLVRPTTEVSRLALHRWMEHNEKQDHRRMIQL